MSAAYVTKSPWVVHYDGSSCNGCDIEVLACLTPGYDVERFGIINCGNPKHADVFLVTGSVNEQNKGIVKQIYEQMPEPKVVVAVGICACSGGIFKDCYNVMGGVLQAKRDAMVNKVEAPAEEAEDAKAIEAAEDAVTEEKKAVAVPPIFTMAEIKVNTMDFLKK